MNIVDIAIAKSYTRSSLTGTGALKGEKGEPGKDAPTITNINIDENNILSTTLSNGTILPGGTIKTINGKDGIQGEKGEPGKDGYSPTIEIKTNTDTEYILNITDKNGSYDTPNLKVSNEVDTGDSSISIKIIDMGDKNALLNLDELFPSDGETSYIIRGSFLSIDILTLDREPVHIQRFGNQLFVTTMNGKQFTFGKDENTNIWTQYGSEKIFVNNDDVLTKTNISSYTPITNYHPATKKYVDDSIKSSLSFNENNELVVTIDKISESFASKDYIDQLDTLTDVRVSSLEEKIGDGFEIASIEDIENMFIDQ